MQYVLYSQDLILDVQIVFGILLPRPKSASCPTADICNACGAEREKPAFCPDVDKGRVNSQLVILSTTTPAAWSVSRGGGGFVCGNGTPQQSQAGWGQKVNFCDVIHTPRNPKSASIFPFLEAM